MGAAGERFAVWWLAGQGLSVRGRNLEIEGGELDILACDGSTRVAVEVRTITGPGDPIDAVDCSKRAHVRRLAGSVGVTRVDFIGIGFRPWGVEVHWLPG